MLLGPSGQNIYPEEIEDKLNSMPLVVESMVVQRDTIPVEPVPSHGRQQSIALTIPPLGAVILRGHGKRKRKKEEAGGMQA